MKVLVAYNCDDENDISSVDIAIGNSLRDLGHEVDNFPITSSDSIEKKVKTIAIKQE